MAITLADFNKIWASSSPLTPYSFTENNYKQGWNFIGSTPPARQMWDFLQKNNDEKMQYLANNYLPLTGGTLTGNTSIANGLHFTFSGTQSNPANSYFYNNATSGFYLETKNDNDNLLGRLVFRYATGNFELDARNASGTAKSLVGTPDGTLTWGGNNVLVQKLENITSLVTVTTTNGTVSEINFLKTGNVVTGYFAIQVDTAVSAGGSITGTISGNPAPMYVVNAAGYVGSVALIFNLNAENFTIRVIGGNVVANTKFGMSIFYGTAS